MGCIYFETLCTLSFKMYREGEKKTLKRKHENNTKDKPVWIFSRTPYLYCKFLLFSDTEKTENKSENSD